VRTWAIVILIVPADGCVTHFFDGNIELVTSRSWRAYGPDASELQMNWMSAHMRKDLRSSILATGFPAELRSNYKVLLYGELTEKPFDAKCHQMGKKDASAQLSQGGHHA
jgi:hypothetical protein